MTDKAKRWAMIYAALIVILIVFVTYPFSSDAALCRTPETRVKLIVEKRYFYDVFINRRKKRNQVHNNTLGLTSTSWDFEFVFKVEKVFGLESLNRKCEPHSEFKITLFIDVFIDPDITNKCIFDDTLVHENRHVKIWTTSFKKNLPGVASRFNRYTEKAVKTTRFKEPEKDAFKKLERYVENIFQDVVKAQKTFDRVEYGMEHIRKNFWGRDILFDGGRQQKMLEACRKTAPEVDYDELKNSKEKEVFKTRWKSRK